MFANVPTLTIINLVNNSWEQMQTDGARDSSTEYYFLLVTDEHSATPILSCYLKKAILCILYTHNDIQDSLPLLETLLLLTRPTSAIKNVIAMISISNY